MGFLGQAGAQQDAYDRAADRSISSQDISYRLVTGFIYDLPFGRDRKFGVIGADRSTGFSGDGR